MARTFQSFPSKLATSWAVRSPALDGLRGIAILFVLLVHLPALRTSLAGEPFLAALAGQLWIGVDIFFVLSGFLITRILLKSQDRDDYFRRFYLRRVLRILPAYLTTLVLIGLSAYFLYPQRFPEFLQALPQHLLFVQNWQIVDDGDWTHGGALRHLWSLAIEEQFYLIWPLLIWLTPKSLLVRTCVALAAMALGLKFALWMLQAPVISIYAFTPARLDGFAAGALVAILPITLIHRWAAPAGRLLAVTATALPVCMVLTAGTGPSHAAFVLTSLFATAATTLLLLLLAAHRLPRIALNLLEQPGLRWLGVHSYGIYLLHLPVMITVKAQLAPWFRQSHWLAGEANWIAALIGYGAALVIARQMYRWLEKPILDLADVKQRALAAATG